MSDTVRSAPRRRITAVLRVGICVTSVITLLLAADLLVTDGHTARGAVTAGRDTGNLSAAQLSPQIAAMTDRTEAPVSVRTTSGSAQIGPDELGLTFDAEATADRLRDQPRNPFSRLLALFGRSHVVDPVVGVDATALSSAIDARRGDLERAAVEGGVHYDGTEPVADNPRGGLRVDRDAAASVLAREWLTGSTVDLPMEPFSPTVSAAVVAATVDGAAERAVSADVVVTGRDRVSVRLTPEQIGMVLTFVPDGRGGLVPHIDRTRGKKVLAGLVRSESKPVNARFSLASGSPTVVPSRDGAAIDWEKTFAAIEHVLVTATAPRSAEAVYRPLLPTLTTAKARGLGVRELVSEFTTGGFSSASGENIRLTAAAVDGALILPGRTFSLNGHTGPRGSAQGYVTSTVIDHGRATNAVGGGISQFATTLYNAAYFAGLTDVDHTEHSYYISRYPEAREATVYDGAIDLVIGNDTRHGVLIETSWSPSAVTVRMWSTKTVEVESITGARYAHTSPELKKVPRGSDCIASGGGRGFTTSNTRVITDAKTGAEISRHTRTVRYEPEPRIRCV
ncbi:VanW family protein [Gordonia sp. NB41Y]|uniref:VanW family protein n=1 Tax=Gordonia sp. NB41Y TaxID=875808 RepID=UPI00273A85DB|nr:VanW family protein [Gordonia sp. NB41Y]WLP88943.1 VanW family protein [Gordonia sp. NB41Y]